jgi:hypothetical protein
MDVGELPEGQLHIKLSVTNGVLSLQQVCVDFSALFFYQRYSYIFGI